MARVTLFLQKPMDWISFKELQITKDRRYNKNSPNTRRLEWICEMLPRSDESLFKVPSMVQALKLPKDLNDNDKCFGWAKYTHKARIVPTEHRAWCFKAQDITTEMNQLCGKWFNLPSWLLGTGYFFVFWVGEIFTAKTSALRVMARVMPPASGALRCLAEAETGEKRKSESKNPRPSYDSYEFSSFPTYK